MLINRNPRRHKKKDAHVKGLDPLGNPKDSLEDDISSSANINKEEM
jgi:hypothetical protein